MTDSTYHYTECGLSNVYLLNGHQRIDTARGEAISFKAMHKSISKTIDALIDSGLERLGAPAH